MQSLRFGTTSNLTGESHDELSRKSPDEPRLRYRCQQQGALGPGIREGRGSSPRSPERTTVAMKPLAEALNDWPQLSGLLDEA
ncbi:MAG: hypothetical protein M3Y55_10785, partial [Pseudomonadota bacterium]|nr:hypothetical protein [Pseudomonadota bacterium]